MSDAILLFGDSHRHPNILWRTGFLAPDPVIYVEADGDGTLIVAPLEFGRAQQEAHTRVRNFEEFGWSAIRRAEGEETAFVALIKAVLAELNVSRVRVEPDFPFGLAQALQEQDIAVTSDGALWAEERTQKRPDEIEAVRVSQQAAQAGVERARMILREAEVRDGMLFHEGQPLTSAYLIGAIEVELLQLGCGGDGTIAAGGPGSAEPHVADTGHLAAHQPVIIDIFPFNKKTRYFGDITRTFVVGEPGHEWLAMYQAVKRAYEAALAAVKPGVAGRDVHIAACKALYDAGYGASVEEFKREGVPAMIHGTGHGVGLEVHEQPRVSDAPSVLREGDVITIEPGLYDARYGGVRIEDTVVVTADGYRNLTNYPVGWKP
jgi:Xaa-Pro aminopeptidase